MKNFVFTLILFLFGLAALPINAGPTLIPPCGPYGTEKAKIQVAILLDTSGSMSGLIDQARQQIWKMVNELATTKYEGVSPDFELALYEYGNDQVESQSNWVRQILPLTTDLDAISEELFALNTDGGNEYCGAVIQQSLIDLRWSNNPNDLKIIFIAGNEPFTQGPIDYATSCRSAIEKSILVNTIFCGNEKQGIQSKWKDGADLADGKFLTINHNAAIAYIAAPQDQKIALLNDSLNATYIGYGNQGAINKSRQVAQDVQAYSYDASNKVERTLSKASEFYSNSHWDIVDAVEEDEEIISELTEEELPEELKGKDKEEIKEFVQEKKEEREKIQAEIQQLGKERKAFLAKERIKNTGENTLDDAVIKTIREQANSRNFCFDK